MPREIPPLYRIYETGDSGAVIYLNADDETLWSVIRRHALYNLEPLYGANYGYRILDLGYSEPRSTVPALNEMGTYIWLDSPSSDSPSDYRHGGRLCWEPIGAGRLRVVYSPVSDLPPNLDMAWKVLDAIHKVYPEARDQLPDIVGLIDSWAYDEPTRDWWRDQVERRLEDGQGKTIMVRAEAHAVTRTSDDVTLAIEPEPRRLDRPPVYSGTDVRATLADYILATRPGISIEAACAFADVARNTYTKHRDSGKLLTPGDYQRRNGGKSLEQHADELVA